MSPGSAARNAGESLARSGYVPPEGSIPTLTVPSLEGIARVHLVGVGGAGMCGIAKVLAARGVEVSGSDLKETRGLDELRAAGATIRVGHDAANLGAPDVVVVSSAIPDANPEVAAARAAGIPVLMRAQALAALGEGRRTIAVAGTHGKTTTTSMLAVILERCGTDPSFVIGGHLNESGSGAHHGEGLLFVAEADESDGSFLLLEPEVAIVTNVEADHLDFYPGGLEEIERAFVAFLLGSGSAVVCGDDPGAAAVLERSGAPAVTYGTGAQNEVRVIPGPHDARGITGRIEWGERELQLSLSRPGIHTLLNAAAAVVTASMVGVDAEAAAHAAGAFSGVHRRFEPRGKVRGASFVDDYAHHPTELLATLAAAADVHSRRVIAVFQPHRYSRTEALGRQLGESLAAADVVVVTDVYAAGEAPVPGVTGKVLVDALTASAPRTRVIYLPKRGDVAPFLCDEVRAGDLVLTLGAGDVTMVADEVLDRLRETG